MSYKEKAEAINSVLECFEEAIQRQMEMDALVARIAEVLQTADSEAMRAHDGDEDYNRGRGRSRILYGSNEKRGFCKVALLSMTRDDARYRRTGLSDLMTALSCAVGEGKIKKGTDIYMNEMYYV